MTACMLQEKSTSKLKFVTLDKESNMSTFFFKNLQRKKSGGEGTGNRDDNTIQNDEVRREVQPRPVSFFMNCFRGRRLDWVSCMQ